MNNITIPEELLIKLSPLERGEFLSEENFSTQTIDRHRRIFDKADKEKIFNTLKEQPHLLISTSTGNGKSTFIKSFLKYISKEETHYVEIIDIKGEEWGNISRNDTGNIVKHLDIDNIEQYLEDVINKVEKIFERRKNRTEKNNFSDVWLVLEEFNSLLIELPKSSREKINRKIRKILYMGRAYKIHIILIAQSHLTQNIGLDRQTQQNLEVIALDRNKNRFQNVYSLIEDKNIFASKSYRENALNRLDKLKSRGIERIAAGRTIGIQPIPDLISFPIDEGDLHPIGELLKIRTMVAGQSPSKQSLSKQKEPQTTIVQEQFQQNGDKSEKDIYLESNGHETNQKSENTSKFSVSMNAWTICRRLIERMKRDGYSPDDILRTIYGG